MRFHPASLAVACVVALPLAAAAQRYEVLDAGASTLTFGYSQMGVGLDGRFPTFDAAIRYDPKNPTQATAHVEVPLAPIDTGSEEGNSEVQGSTWFATDAHPLARFSSTAVKVAGPGALEVSGTLSIKGKQHAITVPVTVAEAGGKATFDGSFTLDRTDFGIGAGMWADADVVAHEVTVSFHLVAHPQPR